MGILTKTQLEELIIKGWSCDERRFEGLCNIESHKTKKFYLLEDEERSQEKLAMRCLKESSIKMHAGKVKNVVMKQNEIIFEPGKFAFLTTKEIINMPLDVGGSMFMIPKVANTGLLFFTLGYVDPGFRGFLTATILNCTNRKIPIEKDQPFFELVLERLEKPVHPHEILHKNPQDTLDVAANILYYNQNPGFVLTSDDFITRGQVIKTLAAFGTIAGIISVIYSVFFG